MGDTSCQSLRPNRCRDVPYRIPDRGPERSCFTTGPAPERASGVNRLPNDGSRQASRIGCSQRRSSSGPGQQTAHQSVVVQQAPRAGIARQGCVTWPGESLVLPALSRGAPGDSDPCCQTCGRGLTTKTATTLREEFLHILFDPRIQKKAGSGGLGVHFGRKQPFDWSVGLRGGNCTSPLGPKFGLQTNSPSANGVSPSNIAQKWNLWLVPSTRKLLWTSVSHLYAEPEHCSNRTTLVSLLPPPRVVAALVSPPFWLSPLTLPLQFPSVPDDCPPSTPTQQRHSLFPAPPTTVLSLHHHCHHRHRRYHRCICLSSCGTGHPPRPTQRIKGCLQCTKQERWGGGVNKASA